MTMPSLHGVISALASLEFLYKSQIMDDHWLVSLVSVGTVASASRFTVVTAECAAARSGQMIMLPRIRTYSPSLDTMCSESRKPAYDLSSHCHRQFYAYWTRSESKENKCYFFTSSDNLILKDEYHCLNIGLQKCFFWERPLLSFCFKNNIRVDHGRGLSRKRSVNWHNGVSYIILNP